jgi:hypothetical protein
MKEEKFLPEGYRFLKLGESIQFGDYFWNASESKWLKVTHPGDASNWKSEQIIRKVER